MWGFLKEDTSEYFCGEPIICLECTRGKYKPGTVIELDFSILDEPNELKKFNGLKGIVVRPLGCNEDLAGVLDYVISWDWKDQRLYDFLCTYHGTENPITLLDPRIPMMFIKRSDDKE